MLERKKFLVGFFVALLSINLWGNEAEAVTLAEKEEARMWGGFRDKITCTVEGSVPGTTEKVVVKEVVVPVYRYPFLFIWDNWYHWGRWHHHHHHHVYRGHHRPPRHHVGRPSHRPPRPAIVKPGHRPHRPSIGRPAPRPSRPAIVKPGHRPHKPTIGRPASRPNRPVISKPSHRPGRPAISRPGGRPGGNRPVMRPAPKSRPRVKAAPPARGDQMIFQERGHRGGGGRHHGGGRPSRHR